LDAPLINKSWWQNSINDYRIIQASAVPWLQTSKWRKE
jgi:hypothetical protein